MRAFADGPSLVEEQELRVTVPVRAGSRLVEIVRALDTAGVDAIDVHRREATLDDVFLTVTGAQCHAENRPTEALAR